MITTNNDRPRVSNEKMPDSETPIGTEVILYPDFNHFDGKPYKTKTLSKVTKMCGSDVIWIESVSGAYAIDCVEVLS